jgi:drug/metabolite transporter (DMT)-like permease
MAGTSRNKKPEGIGWRARARHFYSSGGADLFKDPSSHLTAVFQALFVTFLWSTSWVLIKIGLADMPALTFAGLRYSLAFLILVPFLLRPANLDSVRKLSRCSWISLVGLGLLFYAATQGAIFLGLSYLPAMTVSLLLNFTSIVVALLGLAFLSEQPLGRQWLGVGLSVIGGFLYFHPVVLPASGLLGFIIVIFGVLANAASAILGRYVNRSGAIQPFTVTLVSMGSGSMILLTSGLLVQGLPQLSPLNWAIIAWLAVVNTAFAFTLWNQTLRTLSAMESSIINNTMMIQIAILVWIFLGERLSWQEGIGLTTAAVGTLLVQLRPNREARQVSSALVRGEK